jgi:hypothetical protein
VNGFDFPWFTVEPYTIACHDLLAGLVEERHSSSIVSVRTG